MTTSADLFQQALRFHQQGDLHSAEALYRQVLKADPDHADTLHLLGFLEHQLGHSEMAGALIRRAIVLSPAAAVCHSNLGIVLMDQGRLADAVASYQEALRLNPRFADALANLALALTRLGRLTEAAQCCRQAIQINPLHANAFNLLGNILKDQGHLADALDCYREALRINPQFVDALSNLGIALMGERHLVEAAECFRQVTTLSATHAQAHYNLGSIFQEQGQLAEAVEQYQHAVRINPGHADAYNNLGNVHKDRGELPDAVECYRQALRINSQDVGAHYNLGIVLQDLGHLEDAAACYEEALRLSPDDPVARYNRSFLLLLTGDFEKGWPEYEYRWKEPGAQPRAFAQPRWHGEALPGKTILLYADQGLGDTIQFCRYASLVKERGGTVLLESQPALLHMLEGMPGVDLLIAQGQPLPAFDFQVPLLSLPGVFNTTLRSIAVNVPYLHARPDLVTYWRTELEPLDGFKVGIAWQGNPHHKNDRYRSAPLEAFAPLARQKGLRLLSLQKGPGTDQLRAVTTRFSLLDLSERLDVAAPFFDTAAVMMNLDLVVTVDSALAHLAGALGVAVWVALSANADWRWLLERADCPWYPSMRLFRQRTLGDWSTVFEQMADELQSLIAKQSLG